MFSYMTNLGEDKNFELRLQAEDAVKDILYMYKTCTEYFGLFDDFGWEDGKFDPFFYVDCPADLAGGEDCELQLLHEGSAIKIACGILQSFGQGGDHYPGKAKELIKQNRLSHLPELEEFIKGILESDEKSLSKSPYIYEKYILGYFKRLAEQKQNK